MDPIDGSAHHRKRVRRAHERGPASAWRLAAMPLALCALAALGGCSSALLDPRGPIGRAEKTILLDSLAIMLAIVVPTIVATLGVAWWYRASHTKARYLPDWEFSGRIELVVWAIPLMTIILLGGVTWISVHQLDPARPLDSKTAPLDIEVVSLDWKWLFIYPDARIASVNELVVPAGMPLHLSLTSASVMNTFFVPQLGSMIYTMNGMVTQLNLQADAPGTLAGLSGHFSGDGFSDMHFQVRVLAAQDYADWVKKTQQGGGTLDATAYRELSRQGVPAAPSAYAGVETDLFQRVVSQVLPPGPGPLASADDAAIRTALTSEFCTTNPGP
jgi:cytochrome o ubiquinol oxidase subunit 2